MSTLGNHPSWKTSSGKLFQSINLQNCFGFHNQSASLCSVYKGSGSTSIFKTLVEQVLWKLLKLQTTFREVRLSFYFRCVPSNVSVLSLSSAMTTANSSTSFMAFSWRSGHVSRIRMISGDFRVVLERTSSSQRILRLICTGKRPFRSHGVHAIGWYWNKSGVRVQYFCAIKRLGAESRFFTASLIHGTASIWSKALLAASRSTVKASAFGGGPLKPTQDQHQCNILCFCFL